MSRRIEVTDAKSEVERIEILEGRGQERNVRAENRQGERKRDPPVPRPRLSGATDQRVCRLGWRQRASPQIGRRRSTSLRLPVR